MINLRNLVSFLSLVALVAADCKDTSFDICDSNVQAFETAKGLDPTKCQKFCRDIYDGENSAEKCTFFIFDKRDNLCQLFDKDVQEYFGSCNVTAGTPQPVLSECQSEDSECKVVIFPVSRFFNF